LAQFKKFFNQTHNIYYSTSLKKFLKSPTPSIIFLCIPNPIDKIVSKLCQLIITLSIQSQFQLILIQNGASATPTTNKIIKKANLSKQINVTRLVLCTVVKRIYDSSNKIAFYDRHNIRVAISSINHLDIQSLNKLLLLSNFQVLMHSNYRSVVWSKLIYPNLAGFSTSITLQPYNQSFKNPQIIQLEIQAFKERLKLLKKSKIKSLIFPVSLPKPLVSLSDLSPQNLLEYINF